MHNPSSQSLRVNPLQKVCLKLLLQTRSRQSLILLLK
jgi:hypothetical protein